MKLLIISDIHGESKNLAKIEEIFIQEKCDKLIVLGDLYYNYSYIIDEEEAEEVKKWLEKFQNKLICLKGNCDSKYEIFHSKFSIIDGIYHEKIDGYDMYFTHGNIENDRTWDKENTILIFGHYHIPFIKKENTKIFINPGSISMPRGRNSASYAIYENKTFTIYEISGIIISKLVLDSEKNVAI